MSLIATFLAKLHPKLSMNPLCNSCLLAPAYKYNPSIGDAKDHIQPKTNRSYVVRSYTEAGKPSKLQRQTSSIARGRNHRMKSLCSNRSFSPAHLAEHARHHHVRDLRISAVAPILAWTALPRCTFIALTTLLLSNPLYFSGHSHCSGRGHLRSCGKSHVRVFT